MTKREKALQEFNYFKEMGYGHADLPSSGSIELALAALESPRDWTPCAEGLPDADSSQTKIGDLKLYWVTWKRSSGRIERCALAFVEWENGNKTWFDARMMESFDQTVLAWQPLPAPYRADDTTGKVRDEK